MAGLGWLLLFFNLYIPHGSASFWRLPCPDRSGTGRLDPLFSPGEPSKHSHVIFGGARKSRSRCLTGLLMNAQISATVQPMKT